MSFLSGAAEDGKGSAALPLKRTPDRLMSRRASNLLTVAAAAAVVATIAARMVFPTAPQPIASIEDPPVDVVLPAGPLPTASPLASGQPIGEARRDYAVGLHELRGLPMDASPGTPLELWVAWDQSVAEGPQIQKLVKSVTLSRFIEPATPQGPVVVVLSVPEKAMRAVMYGDLYGSFSVALPTS